MNQLQSITNLARNACDMGMIYWDVFTLAAIAELTETKEFCTSHEISRLVGKSKYHCYIGKLEGVDFIESTNDRGKYTILYKLNETGKSQLEKLLSQNPIQTKDAIRQCNKTKKRK